LSPYSVGGDRIYFICQEATMMILGVDSPNAASIMDGQSLVDHFRVPKTAKWSGGKLAEWIRSVCMTARDRYDCKIMAIEDNYIPEDRKKFRGAIQACRSYGWWEFQWSIMHPDVRKDKMQIIAVSHGKWTKALIGRHAAGKRRDEVYRMAIQSVRLRYGEQLDDDTCAAIGVGLVVSVNQRLKGMIK